MERLEELIRVLSAPAMRSRHSNTVSAICQKCQDKYRCTANGR